MNAGECECLFGLGAGELAHLVLGGMRLKICGRIGSLSFTEDPGGNRKYAVLGSHYQEGDPA